MVTTPTRPDTLGLDALLHMDPQERRDALNYFSFVLDDLERGHHETAAVCAECGWHLILRALHTEMARQGEPSC